MLYEVITCNKHARIAGFARKVLSPCGCWSDREVFVAQVLVLEDFLRGAVEHDLPHVEDDRPISQVQRRDRVLLDDDRGHAVALDLLERLV